MNHYPAISNRLFKFFLENEVSRPLLTHSILIFFFDKADTSNHTSKNPVIPILEV